MRCPRCDAAFGCAVRTGGCWCAAVTLSSERRAQLAAGYDGCLCPACLRELEPEAEPGAARPPLA